MDTTSYQDQVIARENSLLEAMTTNNVELLDDLLHDDLLFNGPDGTTATKAMDLANYRSGDIHLHTAEAYDLAISLIGDTAVVAVTVELQGSYLHETLDGSFRYLRVWKQIDSRWQVIGGSVVPLAV
ncbi:MAG TPA: nuclear transport factor 2 family protein [Herpetosiphonaceae bacterium]